MNVKTRKNVPLTLATLEKAAATLRALAHPHRLKIVEELLGTQHTVGELAQALSLAPPAVSQHLNFMKAHRLLDARRQGRSVYYRVASPHAVNVINCIRKHGPQ
jgi:DNA-binding transcriptional ArsR family regulator